MGTFHIYMIYIQEVLIRIYKQVLTDKMYTLFYEQAIIYCLPTQATKSIK